MVARILVLIYLIFWGCSPSGEKIVEKRFPHTQWVFPDTLWGTFQINEPASCKDLEVQLDLEESYPWRNLYVLAFIEAPDGFRSQSRLEFVFSDSLGRWYVSNRKFRTFVARQISFAAVGTYRVGLLPYIRSDTVRGIRRIALYMRSCSAE
ncbi:MAG: gliding motility lipoprotein GldH [Bacteroidia bacterium]|nr:gliding motility lipoprotein GldH [Bacteroidia bacterium]MDW8057880.1 hypothetical protein [Bacteroidia bacterium]